MPENRKDQNNAVENASSDNIEGKTKKNKKTKENIFWVIFV